MLRILNIIGHRLSNYMPVVAETFRFPHPWLTGLNVYMNTGIHPMVSKGLKTSATFYSTQMETHNSI